MNHRRADALDRLIDRQLDCHKSVSDDFRARFREYFEGVWRSRPQHIRRSAIENQFGLHAAKITVDTIRQMSEFGEDEGEYQRMREYAKCKIIAVVHVVMMVSALIAGAAIASAFGVVKAMVDFFVH